MAWRTASMAQAVACELLQRKRRQAHAVLPSPWRTPALSDQAHQLEERWVQFTSWRWPMGPKTRETNHRSKLGRGFCEHKQSAFQARWQALILD